MALQIDTSAIQSAQRRLDILGNNIANVNTVGFKVSSFEDMIGTALAVSGDVKKAGVMQNFSQGNVTATTNALDIAISGNGLFRMENNGGVVYTRNGQFSVNKDGYIVNSTGDKLTGYGTDVDGNVLKTNLLPLRIDPNEQYAPNATTQVSLNLNLDSRKSVITTPAFSMTDPASYNDTTTTTVYDSAGGGIALQTFYVKTSSNTWDIYPAVTKDANAVDVTPQKITLTFDAAGKLLSTATDGGTPTAVNDGTGVIDFSINGQDMQMNLPKVAQYAGNFSAVTVSQDGIPVGNMTGYKVSSEGQIIAQFSNGMHKTLGQVVLANFNSMNGLASNENNQWLPTVASGFEQILIPGSGGIGTLEGFSTEDSNVDLSSEMIKLISAQRAFQSAAEVVKRQDEIMQNIVNIGR